ncbi:hypothetical protein NPIL_571331, partial [Nephila pilipes]
MTNTVTRYKFECLFLLLGYLKVKVFKHCPQSFQDSKERIRQGIDSIPHQLIRSYQEYLQKYVDIDIRLLYE